MDEQEKEALEEITNKLNFDVKMPPYDSSSGKGYSRDYMSYKEEQEKQTKRNRYEKLCIFMASILGLKAGEKTRKKLSKPLRLLDYEISPGMVFSAAVGTFFISFVLWFSIWILNMALGSIIPTSLLLITGIVPFGVGLYVYYRPVMDAKNKILRSSGEMILAILYMVVYIRASPNLEGAVRFAALNLKGPVAKDLRGVLWDYEVGNYKNVADSLHEYTKVWKDYNDDFLQSLQIIEAAMRTPRAERRENMLQEAIDGILQGTRERMKHYAQSLKTPVMVLNAMGAMLPVLGMIMLPLISVFMGGVITPLHLIILFNIMLPIGLYWFMQHLLSSRPPTTATKPSEEGSLPPRGKFNISLFGRDFFLPAWPVGLIVFGIISLYGWVGYLSFPVFFPVSDQAVISSAPGIFSSGDSLAPLPMLMRSLSITMGLGAGIGVSKILGNMNRKKKEAELQKIEKQFPDALFQLGNKIAGGRPIEVALQDAAEATKEMEISRLFERSSRNVHDLGMTFEQALFNPTHGALTMYPSQLIQTVMRAVLKSSEKGTQMASMTMLTISRYLQNIHKTQEQLTDLMEDTTTTILMLGYLLAPVVSGIAVGMSQTIITALFKMSQSFQGTNSNLPQGAGGTQAGGLTGILGNLNQAIPPELLQFVVGIYLVQLLYILGTFYMKVTRGEDKTYKNMFIGKIMLTGMIFYSLVVIVVGIVFGGVVQSVATSA